jgi:hypothetical protein
MIRRAKGDGTGEIVFEPPHGWGPRGQELHGKMAAFVDSHRPTTREVRRDREARQ